MRAAIPLLPLYAFMAWMENYSFFTISLPHFENWLHLLNTVNSKTKKRYCKIEAVWDVTLCSLVKRVKSFWGTYIQNCMVAHPTEPV